MRLRPFFLWVFLAAFAHAAAADPLDGLDAQLEKMLADWDVPGAAVGIVHEGKLVYARGFGVRELGKPDKVDADTLFYAASTTKAVTALAAGLLVQEGKMSWDAPLAQYLPGLAFADPRATADITVRDALSHRTGYATNEGDLLFTGSTYTARQAVMRFPFISRRLPFRTEFGYSNLMFAAVGEAVAEQSGLSLDEFLSRRFWQPLGMTRTFTRFADYTAQPNLFVPHSARRGPLRTYPHRSLDAAGGAGFIVTSVNDYAKWVALLLEGGGEILQPATLRAVWSPVLAIGDGGRASWFMPETATYSYGLGWFVGDFRGSPLKFHRGNWLGGMAAVGLLPERKLGVIVFENRDGNSFVNAVVYSILERYVPGPKAVDFSAQFLASSHGGISAASPAAALPVRPPAWPLSDYTGRFASEAYGGEAVISLQDGALRLALSAHPGAVELKPVQGEVFEAAGSASALTGARVRFTCGLDGTVTGFDLSVSWDRMIWTFSRLP